MNNNAIRRSLLLWITLPLLIAGQTPAARSPSGPSRKIKISIETGRYEPAPSCKKEVDGCPPKIWTPTHEFSLGMRVWLKATFVNHSNLTAYTSLSAELPTVTFDVIENETNTRPRFTRIGCLLHQDMCTPRADDPDHGLVILSGLGSPWIIPPGKSDTAIEEVTRQFVLSNPGEYTVMAETGIFDLTAKENIAIDGIINKKAVRSSGTVKSEPERFVITK